MRAILFFSLIALAQSRGQFLPETVLPVSTSEFGRKVAISGQTAAIADCCAKYVFALSGCNWLQQAKLASGSTDDFGLSGDTMVVLQLGRLSPFHSAGRATVFQRTGSSWTQQAVLTGSDDFCSYGGSVGISGDTIVAASEEGTSSPGSSLSYDSVYVFVRDGNSWSLQARIHELFGDSAYNDYNRNNTKITIDGDSFAVAKVIHSQDGHENTGDATVYVRNSGLWTRQAVLNDSNWDPLEYFGGSVSISGNTVIVGAPDAESGSTSGAAFVFTRSGAAWSQQTRLDGGAGSSHFGYSVAISRGVALVGEPNHSSGSGAVYSFVQRGSQWEGQQLLPTHSIQTDESFGRSVAIDSLRAVVGAQADFSGSQGSAYVYDGSGICARFDRCDPAVIWINFTYLGTELGCFDQPYNTLAEGIAAVPSGGGLAISPGRTSLTPRIAKAMKIQACGGPVTIGR